MSVAEANNADAGRQFVITGGAGGNGRACARDLLDLGARVLLVDVDDARLFAAVVELGGGQRLQAHRSMLESPAAAAAALQVVTSAVSMMPRKRA
jgi:NAD(P)-dependent dehydrogenase (short-subunit alcohol dehydrogenase family)